VEWEHWKIIPKHGAVTKKEPKEVSQQSEGDSGGEEGRSRGKRGLKGGRKFERENRRKNNLPIAIEWGGHFWRLLSQRSPEKREQRRKEGGRTASFFGTTISLEGREPWGKRDCHEEESQEGRPDTGRGAFLQNRKKGLDFSWNREAAKE